LLRVMDVRGGVNHRQRNPVPVAGDMPLRAVFPAIRGIRACLHPPKTARTEQLSRITLGE
jgi:hypothetical protein